MREKWKELIITWPLLPPPPPQKKIYIYIKASMMVKRKIFKTEGTVQYTKINSNTVVEIVNIILLH